MDKWFYPTFYQAGDYSSKHHDINIVELSILNICIATKHIHCSAYQARTSAPDADLSGKLSYGYICDRKQIYSFRKISGVPFTNMI